MGRTPNSNSDVTVKDGIFVDPAPATNDTLIRPYQWSGIEFAAGIAHDMRAPLATIATSAELLEQSLGPAESTHLINVIQRQAQRLQFMIQDMADYSNIQAGKLQLHPSVLDLTEAVREICGEFQQFRASHRLIVQMPAVPVHVRADADKVRRILENLLSNAFKYSPTGSAVLARVKPPSNSRPEAVIEVEDEGPGIPARLRKQVFEPFTRLDCRQNDGQGLGLHVVKSLAEAHGGRAWVVAGAAGGARFCVALPAHVGEQATEPSAQSRAVRTQSGSRRLVSSRA